MSFTLQSRAIKKLFKSLPNLLAKEKCQSVCEINTLLTEFPSNCILLIFIIKDVFLYGGHNFSTSKLKGQVRTNDLSTKARVLN